MYLTETVAGYSTSVGEKDNNILYFTGAPRYQHTGMVVLFKHNGSTWTVAQRTYGDQVGTVLKKFFDLFYHA